MAADDPVTDSPVEIEGWSPRNYDGKFHGPMRLSDAFARSSNVVAVKVAERAGRDRVIRMAQRLGITADMPGAPSVTTTVPPGSRPSIIRRMKISEAKPTYGVRMARGYRAMGATT